ncbi:M15 family metallopeptidase [Pseudomonas sp. ZM23]|uniref:D-alanyl-D-alanine dipeptidase n=1 Tax=Pseudomonas triclosanedens TaxID=2961893 RepID=A0ABY6ZY38_9PSED|nr:M15 family metallopeptidase [Pseudomonas triclosanedens]MCP8465331.1 M15 family metallopeptidase [Pseudomonas triclosanedens]MCP8470729.1 M15 family metallopeptidase [Pseudomonas triclosanedens]MCP8476630.1 M15 family metallopeptidase [Pseudomonas triclosanedens]WAI48915.1 M15 family metallopeptidase [Pseudomonas triclosanedens]
MTCAGAARYWRLPLLLLLSVCLPLRAEQPSQPGFVYLDQVLKSARYDVRYAGSDNFVGQPIDGYLTPRIILAEPAAQALAAVEKDLALSGLALKIFDGYRPQRAVEAFKRWAANLQDTRNQARYYPGIDKRSLFRDGYIARHSGHSRGSTVDLTLVDAGNGDELDMGSPFDFFGPISRHGTPLITPSQTRNRETLRQAMLRHGFEPYAAEWWHYTLKAEPYPNTYFDFPVQ